MYQIDFKKPLAVHFIGIGGISMSGLAEILLEEEFHISVGVLDVHADLADRDILVVSCVDQTDLAAILVVDFRVRKHAEIGALHLRQLVVGDGTAVIQFGADFCINEERHKRTDDHDACQDLKHAIKKPAKDSKDACRNS